MRVFLLNRFENNSCEHNTLYMLFATSIIYMPCTRAEIELHVCVYNNYYCDRYLPTYLYRPRNTCPSEYSPGIVLIKSIMYNKKKK